MTGPRAKSSPQVPPPADRPAIPEVRAPRVPAALARLTASGESRKGVHQFDKAFPVFITSPLGLANGVGRNISAEGMFIETRDPCPIGTEVRITFSSPDMAIEVIAVAEVRFQAFLNFSGGGGEQEGLRGIGVRFVRFEETDRPLKTMPQ